MGLGFPRSPTFSNSLEGPIGSAPVVFAAEIGYSDAVRGDCEGKDTGRVWRQPFVSSPHAGSHSSENAAALR